MARCACQMALKTDPKTAPKQNRPPRPRNPPQKKSTHFSAQFFTCSGGHVFGSIFRFRFRIRFRIRFPRHLASAPCQILAPSLAHPECGAKKWPNSTLPNFGSTLPIFWPNFGSTLRVPFRILGRLHVVGRIDMAYEILIISLWMSGLGKARPRIVNRGQLRSHMACLAMGL